MIEVGLILKNDSNIRLDQSSFSNWVVLLWMLRSAVTAITHHQYDTSIFTYCDKEQNKAHRHGAERHFSFLIFI